MNFIYRCTYLVAVMGLVACGSMGHKGGRNPANFTPTMTAVDKVLRDTDKLRIKINLTEALELKDKGKIFLSARLLMCLDLRPEDCHDLGNTEGLSITANSVYSYEKEDAKSMSALYSPVKSGKDVNDMLKSLSAEQRKAHAYFKIELRKHLDGGRMQVVGYKLEHMPDLSAQPRDEKHVISKDVALRARPNTAEYGAVVRILVLRPQ